MLLKATKRRKGAEKWLCYQELEAFWGGNGGKHCIGMEEAGIEICDQDGISVFIGKCVLANGYKVCPEMPVLVEHIKSETDAGDYETSDLPQGCHFNDHGKLMCSLDFQRAFQHGSCFRIEERFICKDDLERIKSDMCVDVRDYSVCGADLMYILKGEQVRMPDGHKIVGDFATSEVDPHSALCREHNFDESYE